MTINNFVASEALDEQTLGMWQGFLSNAGSEAMEDLDSIVQGSKERFFDLSSLLLAKMQYIQTGNPGLFDGIRLLTAKLGI